MEKQEISSLVERVLSELCLPNSIVISVVGV